MTQAFKTGATPGAFSITAGVILFTALTGCQVLGHKVDDGIWFPVLLVICFVIFVVWRVRHPGSRRNGWDQPGSNNPGWTDGEGTHLSDSNLGGDNGGDDGGDHSGGH